MPAGVLAIRVLVLLTVLLAAAEPRAQEASRGEKPTPDTVEELGGAMQQAFEEEEEPTGRFPVLSRWAQKLPPFLRDTRLDFHLRTYYFRRDEVDLSQSEAWAIGGALEYRSGWLNDLFRMGAALYTSQPIYAPKDRDGTGLLREGQRGYTVAGQAYGQFRFKEDHELTAYRQVVELPYVNSADTRMTPNTFEAYLVRGSFKDVPRLGQVNYVAGWIDKIRLRDRSNFVKMSKAAGVPSGDDGMAAATLRIRPRKGLYLGVTNQFVYNAFNTFYAEGSWVTDLTDAWQLRLEGQFTHQVSLGKELAPDSPFETWNAGVRISSSYAGAILTLAASTTGNKSMIRTPYGLSPSYLSLMQSDFDRPGEEGWLIGLSYDFARVGLTGFSGFVNFAHGFDARDLRSSQEFATEYEIDATFDYRPEWRWIKGAWLRLRFSRFQLDGTERDGSDVRVILNYDLPIL
jgi:hypothetical protein